MLANPTQIHQVLLNLCVNARDAMPHGGVLRLKARNQTLTPEVAATLPGAKAGAWLVLQVEDTGTGMPPAVLARIWEPFFTTKDLGKGTGLGLPTVRGIVEMHGGFIIVTTEVDHGTTFEVYLPAAERTDAEAPSDFGATIIPGHGENILLADDETTIRETAELCLSRAGYVTAVAENGYRATELFIATPGRFALVVTDIDMPSVDGPTFARSVRRLRPDTKILAMSGSEKYAIDGTWRGFADDFLQKPFTPDQLIRAVQQLLPASAAGDSKPGSAPLRST